MLLKINDAKYHLWMLFLNYLKSNQMRSDESLKGTKRIHNGTQRMLSEPQNNVISYSKWKILTKTRIFN